MFGAYIPTNTVAVALRRAAMRADGTRVWSIIEEDHWNSVLERTGEEIGVFLPDNSASTLPYAQVRFELTLATRRDSFFHLAVRQPSTQKETCEYVCQ